jgi:hypothetical protein
MPSNSWGTPLWKVLHGLVESLGNQPVAFLAADEAHELVFLLRDLEKVMPCALCRKHYHTWRKEHPLEELTPLRGTVLRDTARKWLYDLHEEVNTSRGIQSGLSIEELPALYKPVDIKTAWAEFFTKVKSSTEVGLVSQSVLTNFHRHVAVLRKLVGR